MLELICLGLFLPLVGFLALLLTSDVIERRVAGVAASFIVFLSFSCFASLLCLFIKRGLEIESFTLFNWIPVNPINATFTLSLDHLSILMALIITGIGFLIHVYSIGYMEHEEDYARYFACLNFFIFAMLLLVLAGNLLLLFVGWEGVGLASYLLIGYFYTRPAAAKAATKAFVVNRIGDLGLLLGLILTFHTFGTSDIAEIIEKAKLGFAVGAPTITAITLLYFWGATGKSAQIPLYTWLPDAMEGPTPVSALIHAATMVTAGVYLVVRMHSLFMLAPYTLNVIGNIGAATALFASLCAIGQTDLKRVLAFSTISQLGLMFLACGVGAFYAAMFHLTTHAFIKALLFLSAGNVVHMLNGATNMEKMGGLAKKLPKTNILFLIGVLAMSGIPPFSAFFSKDLILEQEHMSGHVFLFYIGLIASIFTAFYLTRAYCLTFYGHSRLDEKIFKTIKEASRIMLVPETILAILAVFGGILGFAINTPPILEQFLISVDGIFPVDGFHVSIEMWESISGAILGVGIAVFLFKRYLPLLLRPIPALRKGFYINELYHTVLVSPLRILSEIVVEFFEPTIFEGMIRGMTLVTQKIAFLFQRIQSGQIRSYVAWMIIGMVLLVVYFIF